MASPTVTGASKSSRIVRNNWFICSINLSFTPLYSYFFLQSIRNATNLLKTWYLASYFHLNKLERSEITGRVWYHFHSHSKCFIPDNGKPPTLVTSMIDYNMPITMAYMKHMKLRLLNSQQDEVKWKYLLPSQNEVW